MLTVIRRAGEALSWAVDEGLTAPLSLWKIAYEEARTALELTPTQLPALQEAGVVDSGGLGIVVILGGALDYLTTGSAGPAELELDTIPGIATTIHGGEAIVSGEFVHASQEVEWGYCTQFLVEGEGLSPDEFRQDLSGLADSVVVVGDEAIVRVHAHLLDPGHALSYGVERGQLSQIKIDNMSLQNQGWAAGHTSRPKPEPQSGVTVVAVAPGEGLAELFREAGCGAVVSGGQTMNPSIQQLIDAAGDTGVTDVIILPNNRNIVLTAEQAAQGSPDQQVIHVVPSRTAPQGVAALLAFNPTQSAEENVSAMQEAARLSTDRGSNPRREKRDRRRHVGGRGTVHGTVGWEVGRRQRPTGTGAARGPAEGWLGKRLCSHHILGRGHRGVRRRCGSGQVGRARAGYPGGYGLRRPASLPVPGINRVGLLGQGASEHQPI